MKFKLLGVVLLAIFVIAGTSCKSGKKGCNGGGWYGNRNLGYEVTPTHKETINKKETECLLDKEICASVNP